MELRIRSNLYVREITATVFCILRTTILGVVILSEARKYNPLTRKGMTKVPPAKKEWVNVRGRYKFELAIEDYLSSDNEWRSSKEICIVLNNLWPKSGPTVRNVAHYCHCMHQEGRIERTHMKKKAHWRIV